MSEANGTTQLSDLPGDFDPNDPASLAALEKAMLAGAAPAQAVDPMNGSGLQSASDAIAEAAAAAAKTAEPGKDEKAQPDENSVEAKPAATTGETSVATETGKVVQAKDGQHTIPYSVLERERERAARAEQTAQALAEQLQRLQSGKPAAGTGADGVTLTQEDLAQLDQDLPGVAKIIRAQMASIEQLSGTVQSLRHEQEVMAQTREQAVKDEVDAAITANSTLSAWRDAANRKDNPDPLMWNRAADLDAMLREDPAYRDVPIAERFAKVVATVTSLHGAPASAPAPTPTADPKPAAAELKQAADAKLQGLPAAVPTSLSDIPGGVPPAQSDQENLENMSTLQLGQKFLSMTPDQMESYLARIAA